MMKAYVLSGTQAVETISLEVWSKWYENADRRVALDQIGKSKVSTVFLGIDHGPSPDGGPLLFETLVRGGSLDGECHRYPNWDDALVGHNHIVDLLKGVKQ